MRYFIIIILASIFASLHANAQEINRCDTHAEIEAYLLTDFGEEAIWHGLSVDGITVRIYQSDDTGNWTTTVVRDGQLDRECIYSLGIAGTKVPTGIAT
tara:strand:- start:53 stop:349 length:297 start_codon:yes stop_codon:yes gene_type:complete